jgi:hypothetical protein
MPRQQIHTTTEEKQVARREEQRRYREKKKQGLIAPRQAPLPQSGIFISHDAQTLFGANSATGTAPTTPQDIGILADNLDMLGITASQSQPS